MRWWGRIGQCSHKPGVPHSAAQCLLPAESWDWGHSFLSVPRRQHYSSLESFDFWEGGCLFVWPPNCENRWSQYGFSSRCSWGGRVFEKELRLLSPWRCCPGRGCCSSAESSHKGKVLESLEPGQVSCGFLSNHTISCCYGYSAMIPSTTGRAWEGKPMRLTWSWILSHQNCKINKIFVCFVCVL